MCRNLKSGAGTSAAIMIQRLGKEADFLSIGTNDLVQYLVTTDRTSTGAASYYEPLHPAVLQERQPQMDNARSGAHVSFDLYPAGQEDREA